MRFQDARVPVLFGPADQAGPDDAVLHADQLTQAAPFHPAGCACCLPRTALAQELGRLFLARAKGKVPFFRRVVIVGASSEDAAILTEDPLVSAWFRASG